MGSAACVRLISEINEHCSDSTTYRMRARATGGARAWLLSMAYAHAVLTQEQAEATRSDALTCDLNIFVRNLNPSVWPFKHDCPDQLMCHGPHLSSPLTHA